VTVHGIDQLTALGVGSYDWGLDEAAEARARRLHDSSVVVDMLFWGPTTVEDRLPAMDDELWATGTGRDLVCQVHSLLNQPLRWAAEGRLPAFRERWDESGVDAGSFHLQVGSPQLMLETAALLARATRRLDWLHLARTAQDVRDAAATGGHAWILQNQPSVAISRDLGLLGLAHDLGLRIGQLTYNSVDHVGGGCTDRVDVGLTNFGVQVVQRYNELGVIVDVSHSGRQTALDACEVSGRPVICSHTTAAAVHQHPRAKTDEELRAIAATGGIIGVAAVPAFLPDAGNADLDQVLDHLDHMVNVVGVEHVGFGTDWPLAGPEAWNARVLNPALQGWGFRKEHGVLDDSELRIRGLETYRGWPNITRGLVARGYSDADVAALLGGNFLRVLEDVCGR
jgi:membrane dipeptidase